MIRINLLPEDFRRGNRVSTRVLAAGFGAVVAVCGVLGWFGLVYFGDLAIAENELERVNAQLTQVNARAAYHDKLEQNRKDYLGRVQTVTEIGQSRRLWTKFLDEFVDVINNEGDMERHYAWFGGITIKGDAKKGVKVTATGGAVQGSEPRRVANLHEDLAGSTFAKDLQEKSNPAGTLDTAKDREPAESYTFPLEMTFKPTIVEQPKGKAAKPAAKK